MSNWYSWATRAPRTTLSTTLLTDNGNLQAAIASAAPLARVAGRATVTKTYWAQVEGVATASHVQRLARGVMLNDGPTQPAKCSLLDQIAEPWPRTPPIRIRKRVPDCWIELTIGEGRNRQVRRMTATVGLPTLRLIRVAIGPWRIDGIAQGSYQRMSDTDAFNALTRRAAFA